MRQEDLKILLKRRPCPLLRLHLTGGRTFDILDPDEAIVTRSTVEFLMPREKNHEAIVSLLHIIWVEVISSE
jgi:hypothetical protein